MPLLIPALANRDFDQIVAEGRGLLPRLAPEWTDYNISDPGITLLELLGSRLEQTLYRLDRTPAALARNFASRVGVQALPAQVADTVLLVGATNAPINLAAGLQLGAAVGDALFQTLEALDVSAATLLQVSADGIDATTRNAGTDIGPGARSVSAWRPFGADPKAGSMLYLGFDQPLGAPATRVRLYAWTTDPAGDRSLRARLIAEAAASAAEAALCAVGCAAEVVPWQLHYSVRTVWEFHRGGGVWAALEQVNDTTRALSLSGAVEFNAPAGHLAGGPDPARFFIRCRIVRGSYECPPQLRKLGLNAIAAAHAVYITAPELLGISQGHASERFPLRSVPVVPHSTALIVTTPSGPDTSWQEVLDWDASGAHDHHYLLDATGASIAGGNGSRAAVWPAGAALTITYQTGGGAAGNFSAGTLVRVVDSALNSTRYQASNGGALPDWTQLTLTQPFAALGGAGAEDLATTKARAFDAAFEVDRAVTCADVVRLAKKVPSVPVARAQALPNHYPGLPCIDAAGCITLIVVPACPDYRPIPSSDYLAAVRAYLDRRRTLTTELHVRPACFWEVAISATLCSDGRVPAAALQAAAQAALANFFHPLRGGPDGNGWPIGRGIYRAEVMALLSQVRGVTVVATLGLRGQEEPETHCGNLALCPDCLPRLVDSELCVVGPAPLQIIDWSKPHDCS